MFVIDAPTFQLSSGTHGILAATGADFIGKVDINDHRECWHWPSGGAFPTAGFRVQIKVPDESLRSPSVFDYPAGALTDNLVSKNPATEGGGSPTLWKLSRGQTVIGYVSINADTLRWFIYNGQTTVINGKRLIAVSGDDILKFEASTDNGSDDFHFAVLARTDPL